MTLSSHVLHVHYFIWYPRVTCSRKDKTQKMQFYIFICPLLNLFKYVIYFNFISQEHFMEVIPNQEFLMLPADEVAKLLASDDLNVPSEEEIFHVSQKRV